MIFDGFSDRSGDLWNLRNFRGTFREDPRQIFKIQVLNLERNKKLCKSVKKQKCYIDLKPSAKTLNFDDFRWILRISINPAIWGIRGTFAEPSGRSTSDLENISTKLSETSKIMQIGSETKKLH